MPARNKGRDAVARPRQGGVTPSPASPPVPRHPPTASPAISIRGARQHNLKGLDLEIPLGQLTVVTGPSGSGKSSLAFHTLYAEGQRRYVETFSPYVRQFFDRMDKPVVDRIDGIPPAIAIEQKNNVRTTRSTVGTLTEINDYLKLLYARAARGFDPETGDEIRPDSPDTAAAWLLEHHEGAQSLVLFPVPVPSNTTPAELFALLAQQGYLRVLHNNQILRTDEAPDAQSQISNLKSQILVIQDRLKATRRNRRRLIEALETAFHHGKGSASILPLPEDSKLQTNDLRSFSSGWTNPATGFTLRTPTPALFTFNNPLGACPKCRGFGRLIGLDLDKSVPDPSLSLRRGAIKPFQGERGNECQRDLLRCCRERDIDTNTPWEDLPEDIREWIYYGDRKPTGVSDLEASEHLWQEGKWYGVKGFFDWLESRAYKMHVRVFLSRYRSYTTCAACRGRRLQPEALCFKIGDKTLPDLWTLPVSDLLDHFTNPQSAIRNPQSDDKSLDLILTEITSRLGYLCDVGLGYLTLDRPTRTLSGGEIERVNLTTCLGAALSSTLFVLDEPTVGLHARDIDRLVRVMHQLRDKGNTLVVVEHEEAVMRAADNLVDLGPGAGEHGGELVYQGPPPTEGPGKKGQGPKQKPRGNAAKNPLLTAHGSLGTLPWLTGQNTIPLPKKRRKPTRSKLRIKGATRHNLHKLDIDLPLGLFVCLTGVSGSGKSTLAHDVIHLNLARLLGREIQDEPARIRALKGAEKINDVLLVDQSPLARTPRSTPAVLLGAFDAIRQLFAATPDAQSHSLTPGFFSFNSGHGRCDRCSGNGFEKVEMQFLSDLYVTCPACSGRRYLPSTLEFTYDGLSIADALDLTVDQAVQRFAALVPAAKGKQARLLNQVVDTLQPLIDVGLGYLRLGHPLNTLSGGESQRLKLCQLLSGANLKSQTSDSKLLILDEPTTGLHFSDIERLLGVFQRLVDSGHSLLVIEHNIEVIKCADWILDLGPDAGSAGGQLVGNGPPDHIATLDTPTGQVLGRDASMRRPKSKPRRKAPQTSHPASRILHPASSHISLRGAREHNLKNLSLDLPQNQFVVVSGLSGSGKSTLAFDIIFAEGQRRFLDSMSVYARQFAEQLEKPDIDLLSGLPPTVAIEQRVSQGGRKSTVATVTEIWNFVRLLFAKIGTRHCPDCDLPVEKQSLAAIEKTILGYAKKGTVTLLAPLIRARKGYHTEVADWALRNGFTRLLVDRRLKDAEGFQRLERFKEHDIDVVVDEFSKSKSQIPKSLERALEIGHGTIRLLTPGKKFILLSTEASCPSCRRSFDELDPRLFSFNSPHGWCPTCRGHGLVPKRRRRFDSSRYDSLLAAEIDADRQLDRADEEELVPCPECDGSRINEEARAIRLGKLTPSDLGHMSVDRAAGHFSKLTFPGKRDSLISRDILPEIRQRLAFLQQVGLGYLQLDRSARTLSGGEAQRIRLAAQLGSNLRGVLYVLDEPTIGLHPRDNQALLGTLTSLRDKGNSLLVVEHDEETITHADHLIDLGPGAGRLGGEVVYQGVPPQGPSKKGQGPNLKEHKNSPTFLALQNPLDHPLHGSRRKLPPANAKNGWLRLTGCRSNNLRNIDVRIPLSRLTVLTGISGAGKSSLMHGCLYVATSSTRRSSKRTALPYKSAIGFNSIKHTYEVDQSPIGKTSRSCPATYVKIFDDIRKIFAQLPEARLCGFDASRFSFNNEGGRCPECKGNGRVRIEMDFLPTTWVHCEACQGKRYSPQTLEIEYRDRTIGDVLEMTIDEAAAFFEPHSKVAAALRLLADTGLGYLQLGQPSPTLSGGEAQRLKLVTQLIRGRSPKSRISNLKSQISNLYLIEEPTVGLHHEDVRRLIDVLHRLVDEGHTVVVIEHHMDLAAEADYLLDLGPDAGDAGGRIVARGTPEQVAKSKTSRTAPFLRAALGL